MNPIHLRRVLQITLLPVTINNPHMYRSHLHTVQGVMHQVTRSRIRPQVPPMLD